MAGKAYDLHCDTLMKMAKNGGLDEETASMLKRIIASLFELAGERAREEIKSGFQGRSGEGKSGTEGNGQKRRGKHRVMKNKGRKEIQASEEHKDRK